MTEIIKFRGDWKNALVYNRKTTVTYAITLVNQLVNITDFYFTADGVKVDGDTISQTGYALGYTDFEGLQLGYKVKPTGANAPKSVEWSISDTRYMTVSNTGFVELTDRGKGVLRTSNTEVITCTLTNSDGTTVSKSITVTIGR